MNAGHRSVPHTADVTVEAWGPTREECFAQAVAAMAEAFACTAADHDEVRFQLEPASDEELLVSLLEEAIYVMDVSGRIVSAASITAAPGGGLTGYLRASSASEITGAAPKAVTRHDLNITADEDGWRCTVTLDV